MPDTYAKMEDVQSYHPSKTFGSSGSITTEQVQAWLAEDTSFINTNLNFIIDFNDLTDAGRDVLKTINAKLTAHKIDESLPGLTSGLRNEKNKRRDLKKSAMDDLSLIKRKQIPIATKWKPGISSLYTSETPPETIYTKESVF